MPQILPNKAKKACHFAILPATLMKNDWKGYFYVLKLF